MKRRIVRETYKDNTVKYRVEKYKRFSGWCAETKRLYFFGDKIDTHEPLRFYTLEEAKKYCGIPINPIISEEIIKI